MTAASHLARVPRVTIVGLPGFTIFTSVHRLMRINNRPPQWAASAWKNVPFANSFRRGKMFLQGVDGGKETLLLFRAGIPAFGQYCSLRNFTHWQSVIRNLGRGSNMDSTQGPGVAVRKFCRVARGAKIFRSRSPVFSFRDRHALLNSIARVQNDPVSCRKTRQHLGFGIPDPDCNQSRIAYE